MISQRASAIERVRPGTSNFYIATVAPHAKTERWRYTVPAGKKAFLQGGHLQLRRAGAGGAVSDARGAVTLEIDGIERAHLCRCYLSQLSAANTLSKQKNITRDSLLILENQSVKATTVDVSSAGTVSYYLSASFMEFEA